MVYEKFDTVFQSTAAVEASFSLIRNDESQSRFHDGFFPLKIVYMLSNSVSYRVWSDVFN